jgi:hypothetical protein
VIAALRRVPAPLLVIYVATIALLLVDITWPTDDAQAVATGVAIGDHGSAVTVFHGSWLAGRVLVWLGFAMLTRRLSGRARIAARVATLAAAMMLALCAISIVVIGPVAPSYLHGVRLDQLVHAQQWVFLGLSVVTILGIGAATCRPSWIAAAVLFAAVRGAMALRPFNTWLFEVITRWTDDDFDHTLRLVRTVGDAIELLTAVALLALAAAASRDAAPEAPDPRASSGTGLRGIALALTGQMIAFVALGVIAVIQIDTYSIAVPHSALELLAGVEVVCLLGLARGCLFATGERGPLPSWLLVACAGAAMCVAGAAIARLATLVLGPDSEPLTLGNLDSVGIAAAGSSRVLTASAGWLLAAHAVRDAATALGDTTRLAQATLVRG